MTVEEGLAFHVSVSTIQPGEEMIDHALIQGRLAVWRANHVKSGLTGALLISGDGIVLVLEGTEAAIEKQRKRVDRDPLHTNIRKIDASPCLKRRFGAWPLAYVPSSRWVERALTHRALAGMVPDSPSDGVFLIDLVLSFVGDGA